MNNNKSFVIALALILALIKLSNGAAITNSAQQNIILNMHNEQRRSAAKGQIGYGFGTAAKMYPLTWDSTLANTAERWASSCDTSKHNVFGTGNGQNMGMGWGDWSDDEAIKTSINGWIKEKSEGPYAEKHFTQMVADRTFRVGCALYTNCNNVAYLFVCNYDPEGNMINQPAYTTSGSTGSQCPNGVNNGLCSGTPQQSGSGGGSSGGSSGGESCNFPGDLKQSMDEFKKYTCNNGWSCSMTNGVIKITCNSNGQWKEFQ